MDIGLAWALTKSQTDTNFDKVRSLFGIPAGEKIIAVFRRTETFDVIVLHGSIEKPELAVIQDLCTVLPGKRPFTGYSKKLERGFELSFPDVTGKTCRLRTKNALITPFVFAPELSVRSFSDQIQDGGWKTVTYEEYLACTETIHPENTEDTVILSDYTTKTRVRITQVLQMYQATENLARINTSLDAKNYDYCNAGHTCWQGILNWKKTVVCNGGKLYAGVEIQDTSFKITVEPFKDRENHCKHYNFSDKNNSAPLYLQVAAWETQILEELSSEFDFLKKGDVRKEPYSYGDFKFMKYDIQRDTPLQELAKAVDTALKLIAKHTDSLSTLDFSFTTSQPQ